MDIIHDQLSQQVIRPPGAHQPGRGGVGIHDLPGLVHQDGVWRKLNQAAVALFAFTQLILRLLEIRDVAGADHRAGDSAICAGIRRISNRMVAAAKHLEFVPGFELSGFPIQSSQQAGPGKILIGRLASEIGDRVTNDLLRPLAACFEIGIVDQQVAAFAIHQRDVIRRQRHHPLILAQALFLLLALGDIPARGDHRVHAAIRSQLREQLPIHPEMAGQLKFDAV